jgi:hypothetical protein
MHAGIADGMCTLAFMGSIKAELLNPRENYFRLGFRQQSIFVDRVRVLCTQERPICNGY